MKRGCTQCGECLNVCPVYALFKREEYSPKGKRLLMEPLDGQYGKVAGELDLTWERIRELSRLCAGCGRCQRQCARKLSTAELLADARARNPHWTQKLWDVWIRRAGPLWPLAGRIATLVPMTVTPAPLHSSLETARALVSLPPCEPWLRVRRKVDAPPLEALTVALFSGCTAINARPQWVAKAEKLLRAWGYRLADTSGFTCCGGTLHHAGEYNAQAEVRRKNIDVWRNLGKPIMVSFCASCKHSLEEYADAGVMPEAEAKEWKGKMRGLSSLLTHADMQATSAAPQVIGYHEPCHWNAKDPDMPFLKAGLPGMTKGAGLCCGMGGILKMTNPDLSADMARNCLEGMDKRARHILTGCSGCAMQLASVAPEGVAVRHWLDVVEADA